MKVYGIFTQIMSELLRYSKKNDTAKATFTDFANMQNLEQRIHTCYDNNYCTYSEYRVLIDTCTQIKTTMREVIRLNHEVKAIEKHIRKSRRKYA